MFLTSPRVNISEQELKALDAGVTYRYTMGDFGTFSLSSKLAYTFSYVYDSLETVAKATNSTFNGTIPRWTTATALTFNRGPWSATVFHRYIPSVFSIDDAADVGKFQTVDIGIGYSFGDEFGGWFDGLRLNAMVKNVSDAQPPLAPNTFTDANADVGTYDPRGRRFIVQANYKF